jgi:hypothetical protein
VRAVSGSGLVEQNRLDLNTFTGIRATGEHSIVRANIVLDTGGRLAAAARGIDVSAPVDVIDNIVAGVASDPTANLTAYGVLLSGGVQSGSTVKGNHVRGLGARWVRRAPWHRAAQFRHRGSRQCRRTRWRGGRHRRAVSAPGALIMEDMVVTFVGAVLGSLRRWRRKRVGPVTRRWSSVGIGCGRWRDPSALTRHHDFMRAARSFMFASSRRRA